MIQKTNYKIDIQEVLNILEMIKWNKSGQLCVTSRSGNSLTDGEGSINDYKSPEYEFNQINSQFKNTSIESMLNQLKNNYYSYGRVRIMALGPKKTYSYHMDKECRIHFALSTNSSCMLIVNDTVVRVPKDSFGYLIETTKPHTAINCSNEVRIHLVVNLLYPIKKIKNDYLILNKLYTQKEFDDWKQETKPPTAIEREDYYFVDKI